MADAVFGWASKAAAASSEAQQPIPSAVSARPVELSSTPAPRSVLKAAAIVATACGLVFASSWWGARAAGMGGLTGTAGAVRVSRAAAAGASTSFLPPPPAASAGTSPGPPAASAGTSPGPPAACELPKHSLTWFEVGCSDFDTLIQLNAAGPNAHTVRGMSVDAVPLYTRRLPQNMTHGKVVNAAVVGWARPGAASTIPVFYTPPDAIATHGLPVWMKGCNSVGKPHPTAAATLKARGLDHLMKKEEVPVATLADLLHRAGGCRIETFKIDVEGMDAELLTAYAAFLWAHPACHADRILFETNELSAAGELDAARAALAAVGYPQAHKTADAYNEVVHYEAAEDARRWGAAVHGRGGVLDAAAGRAWLAGKGLPEVKAGGGSGGGGADACKWGST